jgi:hypothetical protein
MKFKILTVGGLLLILSGDILGSLVNLNINYNIFLLLSSTLIGISTYILTKCYNIIKSGE